MIKLAALNEDWSDDSSCEHTEERAKETRESEALELYNKALQFQQQGNHERAKEYYDKLLNASFVAEVGEKDKDDDPQSHPGLAFKYSAYKNLASLAEEQSNIDNAVDLYLEAAAIDDTDVTLWYKIGKLAVKLNNVRLARYAFEQGLNCNSQHWPCLDELITVLFAIGDYHSCLHMISSAFERDASYPKGLIMRDRIYAEYESFRSDFQHLRGMTAAKNGKYDQDLVSQIVKEGLDLRARNSQRNVEVEPVPVVPAKHLALYTWSSLGNCLVALYDQVTSDENNQSVCQKVNLENYCKIIITPEVACNSASQKMFMKENDDKRTSNSLKRKKPVAMESDRFSTPKRRSARVSKSKKKQEEINYLEILQEFLPKSLRTSCLSDANEESESLKMDSQEDRYEKAGLIPIQGMSSEIDISNVPDISSENEPLDVQTFVKKHLDNCGTLDLLCDYALHLTNNCQFKWSVSLVDVFLKIYSRVRPHLSLPPILCPDSSKTEIMSNAQLVLVAIELTLDKWCTEKSKSSSSLSPAGSPRGNSQAATISPLKQDPKFHGKYFLNDLEFIAQAAGAATSLLERDGIKFALRVNWAKVRFMMFQGQMNLAVIYLDRCNTLIELSETPITVHLVNCKTDNIITIGQVRKKLESLQRCQSLEEVHRLYESGQYQEVVDVLLSSLHHPPLVPKVGSGGMSIPERPAQLLLLQDSLLRLKEYKTCLACAEVAFNEAVGQITPCEAWSTTLERIFQCVNTILSMDSSLLYTLHDEKVQRLTQNLIKVIEVSMDSAENSSDVPLATVMPWMLLYRIIRSKEDGNEVEEMELDEVSSVIKMPEPDTSESPATIQEAPAPVAQVSLPLSLQFLRLGHEALGGRSWCINNDGMFLLLYVDVFLNSLKEKSPPLEQNRDKLVRELEQCFFCLYGHPSKKAKARGLQEHGSSQIPLTWSNSAFVFEFFKSPILPTFEDKTNTVTSEVQNLLRRIILVIPQTELQALSPLNVRLYGVQQQNGKGDIQRAGLENCYERGTFGTGANYIEMVESVVVACRESATTVITVESVQNFIDGSCDQSPALPSHLIGVKRPVICEIFYLLADSYFKNKEFSKAIKFYIHDICSNPNRFDTWAAMALARQVRLEDKLRACEPKSEGPIQKHSISTLRCFKRALEIDNSNTNLWGEYGSLSYCLHSYASRQLNQVETATPENQKVLEDRRKDMLIQAKNCFDEALHKPDNDEPWLQCYMLGKIAEKLSKPPEEYLESYLNALKELDKDDAEYPRKIAYHNPPNLALEAIEVAFRFHASTLKLLKEPIVNPDYQLLDDYLNQVSQCPFYQANQKTAKDDELVVQKLSPERGIDCEKITETSNYRDVNTSDTKIAESPNSSIVPSAIEMRCQSDAKVSETILGNSDEQKESRPASQETSVTDVVIVTNKTLIDEKKPLKNYLPEKCPVSQSSNAVDPHAFQKMDVSDNERADYTGDPSTLSKLIHRCLEALAYGLQRFPQHYKSQYRLAHAYLHIPSLKNAKFSRDLLLGSNYVGEKPFRNLSVQGLLNEKSKTNLFQGIWRIPLDEVDRPGSFCTHMYKSVKLLIDVLDELQEWYSLLLVSSLMYRSPDSGKKYLRDNERLQLASKAFTLSLKLLTERLEQYKQQPNPGMLTTSLLTDAYEAYKCSQKVQKFGEETEKFLSDVFKFSGLHKDDSNESGVSILDKALKYFQLQLKHQASSSENEEKTVSKIVNNISVEEPTTETANIDSFQSSSHRITPDDNNVPSIKNINSQTTSQTSDSVIVPQTARGGSDDVATSVFHTSSEDSSQVLPALIRDGEKIDSQENKNSS